MLVLSTASSAHAQGYPGGGYPGGGADTYSVTYSGGVTTATGPTSWPPGSYTTSSAPNSHVPSGNAYGGGDANPQIFSGQSVSINCQGTVTTTFTWNGGPNNDPPPPANSVIVVEQVYASAGGNPTGTAGGDIPWGTTTGPNGSQTYTATRYSVHGSSFTVTCTPTASASSSPPPNSQAGASGFVGYTATPYPVTIMTTAIHEPSGDEIMVGQNCTVSLAGIPSGCTVSNYQWSVTGTTFQSWSPITPANGNTPANYNATSYVDGPGPLTNPTASWYWNDLAPANETVTCTATVTPPAGQGSAFTITVTKAVNVFRPMWTAFGTGGYMQVNTAQSNNGSYMLYAGPTAAEEAAGQYGGMNWKATADFSSHPELGIGTLELAQIVSVNEVYTNGIAPFTHANPFNGQAGLDASYPYSWAVTSYSSNELQWTYITEDLPGLELTPVVTASLSGSFNDYLMFTPAFSTQPVPIAAFHWTATGNATLPNTNNWSDYVFQNGSDAAGTVFPNTKTTFTPTNTFPSWTVIIPGTSF